MSFPSRSFALTLLGLGWALASACQSDTPNDADSDEADGGASSGPGVDAGGHAGAGAASGATGGETGANPNEPEIFGVWVDVCPRRGQGGAPNEGCSEWYGHTLRLAKTDVVGGPLSAFDSSCIADHVEYPVIAFEWDGRQLELFDCPADSNGADGEGPRRRVFAVEQSRDRSEMTLTSLDGDTYLFERRRLPRTGFEDLRLLEVQPGSCEEASKIRMQVVSVEGGSQSGWFSGVSSIGDALVTDHWNANDGLYADSFGPDWRRRFYQETMVFSEEDDRGARTGAFSLKSGAPLRNYYLLHAPDLTPVFAVGFEKDDCSSDAPVRGFEYDFKRNVVFRRFSFQPRSPLGSPISVSSGVPLEIEVSGMSGLVKEVVVTVSSGNSADAELEVTSPDGTTVVLAASENGDGGVASFGLTIFSDRATKSITDETLTTFADHLRPENPLSTFVGEKKNGTWTLNVTSTESVDVDYFGLSIR